MAADVESYRDLVRPLVEGRRVVLVGGGFAAWAREVSLLRSLGSDRCLCVVGGDGTGECPDPSDTDRFDVGIAAPDIIAEFREWEKVAADPPAELLDTLDTFDPEHRALVLVPNFTAIIDVGDRPVYGARRPEWVALEDKAAVDEFFDAAGVPYPPSEVVPAAVDPLVDATARLDRGSGTVWAGDARDGFNGGAVFVRWIRDESHIAEAVGFLGQRCDRVRVAPFVEGVPCSIHGFVTARGVAVFRPVEMLTLRHTGESRLHYAGTATFWDPAPAGRSEMERAAEAAGSRLKDEVGFRGLFTVDGIMSEQGFVATELNPRFGAGIRYAFECLPNLPLELVHRAAVAGDAEGLDPDDLERLVLDACEPKRLGVGSAEVRNSWDATAVTRLVYEGGRFREALDDERATARLLNGPGRGNEGYVLVELHPERTAVGPSVAPRVTAALAFADEHLDAGIGPLEPARDVTPHR